jgi:hypothetical protein
MTFGNVAEIKAGLSYLLNINFRYSNLFCEHSGGVRCTGLFKNVLSAALSFPRRLVGEGDRRKQSWRLEGAVTGSCCGY